MRCGPNEEVFVLLLSLPCFVDIREAFCFVLLSLPCFVDAKRELFYNLFSGLVE